jgi:transcriptional regulator with XRE-family HTH domain
MLPAKNLGELVCRDRELAGLTQDQLVAKLNKVKNRPTDPFTKKPKLAHRSWLAKLEAGRLRRGLRLEVRIWLAKALDGNIDLYQKLPIRPSDSNLAVDDFDVLPLVKHLAQSDKQKLPFEELCRLCEAYKRCADVGVSLIAPLTQL